MDEGSLAFLSFSLLEKDLFGNRDGVGLALQSPILHLSSGEFHPELLLLFSLLRAKDQHSIQIVSNSIIYDSLTLLILFLQI